jgi:hypothetical protein
LEFEWGYSIKVAERGEATRVEEWSRGHSLRDTATPNPSRYLDPPTASITSHGFLWQYENCCPIALNYPQLQISYLTCVTQSSAHGTDKLCGAAMTPVIAEYLNEAVNRDRDGSEMAMD